MVKRAIDAASAAVGERLLLVLGHEWQAVSRACMPFRGFQILNDRYRSGIGTSLSLAVRTIRHAADAIIVLLADQPLITANHVQSLRDTWSGDASEIIVTAFNRAQGPPALFPKSCFADLAALGGDVGARGLLDDPRFRVKSVVFDAAAVDVDTREDLARL